MRLLIRTLHLRQFATPSSWSSRVSALRAEAATASDTLSAFPSGNAGIARQAQSEKLPLLLPDLRASTAVKVPDASAPVFFRPRNHAHPQASRFVLQASSRYTPAGVR